jgi:hypothetical protein
MGMMSLNRWTRATFLVAALTASSVGAQPVQFKANVRMVNGSDNRTTTGTAYFGGAKIRTELTADGQSMVILVDPAASIAKARGPAGDFLYRFGDPARYQQGDPPRILENWDTATSGHKQMGGSHHAHWIEAGLPGAGHLMVFNNGQYLFERTPQSSILEINPYLDGSGRDTGKYVNPPDAGYREERYDRDTHKAPRQISKQVVWTYRSKSNMGSSAISDRAANAWPTATRSFARIPKATCSR